MKERDTEREKRSAAILDGLESAQLRAKCSHMTEPWGDQQKNPPPEPQPILTNNNVVRSHEASGHLLCRADTKTLYRISLALVLTLDYLCVLEAKGNDFDKR